MCPSAVKSRFVHSITIVAQQNEYINRTSHLHAVHPLSIHSKERIVEPENQWWPWLNKCWIHLYRKRQRYFLSWDQRFFVKKIGIGYRPRYGYAAISCWNWPAGEAELTAVWCCPWSTEGGLVPMCLSSSALHHNCDNAMNWKNKTKTEGAYKQ